MEDKSSVRLGWEAMIRHPLVWLLVMAWDFTKWGLGWLGDMMGFGWIRIDFNIGYMPTPANGSFWVKLMLPPALPGAEALYPLPNYYGGGTPNPVTLEWVLVSAGAIVLITLLEPLIRAGYLNLLNASIRGVRPTTKVFWRGVRRFGLAQVILTLLWWPVAQLWFMASPSAAPWLAQLLLNVAVLAFYTAQYMIVTDDANVLQAFVGAPFLLFGHLGSLLIPVAFAGLVTGFLTGALSALGIAYAPVLIPLYAIGGTGLAVAMLAAIQEGIGTRTEPGMPWACKHCRAQNDLGKTACVVCGKQAKDEPKSAKVSAAGPAGSGQPPAAVNM